MKGSPIFIHSLFRTGSTYLWNKFRRADGYHCYYEPLHPDLKKLSPAKPFAWDSSTETAELMRHPVTDRNKHAEYEPLLVEGRQGVPFFKDSFSYSEYCENGENPDLKRYIDFLIEHAGDRTPVFKLNRSALRVRWFKAHYPTGVHLYLLRDPRGQWASYNSLSPPEVRDLFLSTDLLIVSLNRDSRPFAPLAGRLPLIRIGAGTAEDALAVYGELLSVYSQEERYLLFYYVWLVAFLENLRFSDAVFSIDFLCNDPSYREKARAILASFEIHSVDFEDARMKPHPGGPLSPAEMGEIESKAQAMIRGSMDPKALEEARKVCRRDARFGVDFESMLGAAPGWGEPAEGAKPDPAEALRNKVEPLGRRLASHANEIKALKAERKGDLALIEENRARMAEQSRTIRKMENDLHQKARQLSELDVRLSQAEKALSDIRNSYTFMAGRMALAPLQLILRLAASLRGRGGSR